MFTRQKVILHLISQSGGEISRLQLVKWAFILAQSGQSKDLQTFYQFVPYKHGPCSFNLYHELGTLARNGYIDISDAYKIRLNKGLVIPPVKRQLEGEISMLVTKYRSFSIDQLLQYVYSQYPWYTIKSDQRPHSKSLQQDASCAVYTVGYEGLQIDGFLDLLLRQGISRIIDVRNNPVSRHYGFHKTTLSTLCKYIAIEYEHMPELGMPSKSRSDLKSTTDYEQLFEWYDREVLQQQEKSLRVVTERVKSQPSALVCMEADPKFCHRSRLAQRVSHASGLAVCDLRSDKWNRFSQKQECLLPL